MVTECLPSENFDGKQKFSHRQTIYGEGRAILFSMGKTNTPVRRFFFREHAKAKGKRQARVADDTGLTPGYISALWNGDKEPSADALAKIAASIGVAPADIMVHPETVQARAAAAIGKVPKDKQETALEMLEGLAEKRRS